MNLFKQIVRTVSLYLALSMSAMAQTPSVIEVDFGSIYGNVTPTTVVSGTGTLGEALSGSSLFWVCMDNSQDSPEGSVANFTVSTDPSVLQVGIWASLSADGRAAAIEAATNMYYFYQEELTGPLSGDIGYSYQSLVWSVANAYYYFGHTGPLDSALVDLVSSQQQQYFDDEPWLEPLLDAMLITPTGEATVYFGNPIDDLTLQPVIFFPVSVAPVPEPSTLLLTGVMGVFFLSQRRRKHV